MCSIVINYTNDICTPGAVDNVELYLFIYICIHIFLCVCEYYIFRCIVKIILLCGFYYLFLYNSKPLFKIGGN